ncbi:hypothetical protein [Streptomyces sp. DG1A-41]|uniref:hypothetical protein n=1 Tax=Streptomyces sp. DG1A-41 TaxID=3125779 RepID=UPI0030CB6E97
MADEVVEYAVEGRAEWSAAMAASATVRVEPDETAPELILVAGTCPRCRRSLAHAEPLVSYRAINRDDPLRPGIGALLRDATRRAAGANRSPDVSHRATAAFRTRARPRE